MRVLLCLLFCCCMQMADAQFSVFSRYHSNTIEWQDRWEESVGDDKILTNSVTAGVAYWLRLKEKRVEFHPGILYSRNLDGPTVTRTDADGNRLPDFTYEFQHFGVEVPVQVYPLDFKGDCNCPTFSKQGTFIDKGFFLFANPAVHFKSIQNIDNKQSDTYFDFSFGAGLDIGLGDLFTISPHIGYSFSPNNVWEELSSITPNTSNDGNLRTILAGLRLSFRPDYVKQRRAMFR